MLKVKIGSTWIESQGLEIPVTLKSPLPFEGKRVSGSYIFNFSIPYTDALKKEAKYIHRPGSNNPKVSKLPFYLEQGPIKYRGECSINSISDQTVEISALINTGVLVKLLKETKMADVDLGGLRIETGLLRADAKTPSDIVIEVSDSEEAFVEEENLAFAIVSVNTSGEMFFMGSSFTSNSNRLHSFTYTISYKFYALLGYLRTYVNDELKSSIPLICDNTSQSTILAYSQILSVGDVVTWKLYVTSRHSDAGVNLIIGKFNKSNRIQISRQSLAMKEGADNMFPYSDYAVFPLHNSKLLDSLPDDLFALDQHSIKSIYEQFFPIVNYFNLDHFPMVMAGESNDEHFSAYNLFVPFPYLAYFVSHMAKHLGFTISENSFIDSDLKQLVIYNAFAENEYLSSNLTNIIEGFDLTNHVPDEQLSDFISDVCALLAIAFDYDSYKKALRFVGINSIINNRGFVYFPGIITEALQLSIEPYKGYILTQEVGPDSYAKDKFKPLKGVNYKGEVTFVGSLGSKPKVINDCYYVTSFKQYWYYNYDEEFGELNWMFYSNEFRHTKESINETIDGEIFEIKPKWAACMMNGWSNNLDTQLCCTGTRYWSIPHTEDAGSFESMPPQFASKFSKYLLFYRGMQLDSEGNLYPLGSNDVYDYAQNKISNANLSLRWDGEYGLYEKRHKAWVQWAINQPGKFTTKAYLTPLQLSKLDFFKWYRINSHDFLIAEIRFNITETDVSQVEIDLYRR